MTRNRQKSFFEDTAKKFGADAILIPGGSKFRNRILNKIMETRLKPILINYKNNFILEIGVGIGRWTKIISEDNTTVGIDISRSMVQRTKKNVNPNKCSLVVADSSYLPFKPEIFDVIISITVIQHILKYEDFSRAISEISRCSKNLVVIVEEMWSKNTVQIQAIHYPIRISSVNNYKKLFYSQGFNIKLFNGLTFTPFTIFLAKMSNHTNKNQSFSIKRNPKHPKSRLIINIIDFLLGTSLLSDLLFESLLPQKKFNPKISLHTLMQLQKKRIETRISF